MELKAEKRKILGKKVKVLRRGGVLPAILFGGKEGSIPLELNAGEFGRIYKEAGESTLLDLDWNGKKEKILIAEVQRDPLGKLLHADLRRVAAGEKITATVPVEVVGESIPVKAGEGVLLTLLNELEVECLPQDLPQKIAVDISGLTEIGTGIALRDLPIDPAKVAVVGHAPDELVVKVDFPQEEEVEEVPVTEAEAVAGVEALAEKPEGEEGGAAEGEGPGKTKEAPQESPKEEKSEEK
uniref:Large ribosomal subunit protein bL25 n=1 Tax=candidate division WWE3 bacterium TaxID=2053526 RepID=A0A831Z2K3_UNCKA